MARANKNTTTAGFSVGVLWHQIRMRRFQNCATAPPTTLLRPGSQDKFGNDYGLREMKHPVAWNTTYRLSADMIAREQTNLPLDAGLVNDHSVAISRQTRHNHLPRAFKDAAGNETISSSATFKRRREKSGKNHTLPHHPDRQDYTNGAPLSQAFSIVYA